MRKGDIIAKLKEQNLTGRGGAGFPTWLKWQAVREAKAEKKYIVCNAGEGEPKVFKDGFLLENYPEEIIEGIKIALKTIDNSSAFIYLRKDYYQRFKKNLEKLAKGFAITLFKKTGGYLAGEETVLLQAIEGKRLEPRLKPPFPTQVGLWGYPTLINNTETFYFVSQIAKDKYKKTRFFCVDGDVKNKGVFELPEDFSIERILKESNNLPDFDFFLQVGGRASGEILLPEELNQPVKGIGSILVFNQEKTDPFSLMEKWADFFLQENCDRCVPCREGVFRIKEMLKEKKIDKELLSDIFFVLEKTSLCPLGKGVSVPFKTLVDKLLK